MFDIFRHTAAIILSAGKSERMEFPKALLKFDSDTTFLEKLVEKYRELGIRQIVIVTNSENNAAIKKLTKYNWLDSVKIVVNENIELGKLHSVKTGLRHVSPDMLYCYLQDVDRPLINRNLLLQLYSGKLVLGYSSLVYQNKRGHPILIGKNVIGVLKKMPVVKQTLNEVLKQFPSIDSSTINKNILVNINTPEDYATHFGDLVQEQVE